MEEYTKEFFWDTYKTLPEELKEAIFDEKNNQIIYNICSKLGLDENQSSIVAKYTGRVLMGLLPLKDFGVTLELELNADEFLATKITQEINFSIFKHLRLALSRLEEQKTGHRNLADLYEEPALQAQEFSEKDSSFTETKEQPTKIESAKEDSTDQGGSGRIKFPSIRSLKSFLSIPKEKKSKPEPVVKNFLPKANAPIDLSDRPAEELKKAASTNIDFTDLSGQTPITTKKEDKPAESTLNFTKKIKVEPAPEKIYRESLDEAPPIPSPASHSKNDVSSPKSRPLEKQENQAPAPSQIPSVKSDHFDPYREAPI